MAGRVTIQRVWPDQDMLTISVRLDTSYPDSVREGVRAALDAYSEALGLTVGPTEAEGDE